MTSLVYESGEDIRKGDRVRYHGEAGYVEFVVKEASGDPSFDWYLDQWPGGGAMICADTFGSVYLSVDGLDDFLEFVARGSEAE